MSYSNCTNVAVNNGATATCTITNNDKAATLIVLKEVINDSGGTRVATAFSFSVNGGTATPFANDPAFANGLHGRNSLDVDAGTYTVTEPSIPSDYSQTPVRVGCDSVTIAAGETKTCTITNNDAKASPGATSDQSAVLHDRLDITGIRTGASDAANARVTFSLHTAAGCATAPVATAEIRTISMAGTAGTAVTVGVPRGSPGIGGAAERQRHLLVEDGLQR